MTLFPRDVTTVMSVSRAGIKFYSHANDFVVRFSGWLISRLSIELSSGQLSLKKWIASSL